MSGVELTCPICKTPLGDPRDPDAKTILYHHIRLKHTKVVDGKRRLFSAPMAKTNDSKFHASAVHGNRAQRRAAARAKKGRRHGN